MIVSPRRLAANRRNAQKSTGPKTALRHCLTTKHAVTEQESDSEFAALRRHFFSELKPVGPLETVLVQQLIMSAWRLRRLRAIESGLVDIPLTQQAPTCRLGAWKIIPAP